MLFRDVLRRAVLCHAVLMGKEKRAGSVRRAICEIGEIGWKEVGRDGKARRNKEEECPTTYVRRKEGWCEDLVEIDR